MKSKRILFRAALIICSALAIIAVILWNYGRHVAFRPNRPAQETDLFLDMSEREDDPLHRDFNRYLRSAGFKVGRVPLMLSEPIAGVTKRVPARADGVWLLEPDKEYQMAIYLPGVIGHHDGDYLGAINIYYAETTTAGDPGYLSVTIGNARAPQISFGALTYQGQDGAALSLRHSPGLSDNLGSHTVQANPDGFLCICLYTSATPEIGRAYTSGTLQTTLGSFEVVVTDEAHMEDYFEEPDLSENTNKSSV